jgi:hypothetical protein
VLSDLAPLRSWSVRHDRTDRLTRLDVPAGLRTDLGCDAVGVPARHGFRLLGRITGAGCVFADGGWQWWIVPAGSDQGLTWPLPSHYAPGALVPAADARLIHRPEGPSPYTPPIPLYLMLCQLTGTQPRWPAGVGGPGRDAV